MWQSAHPGPDRPTMKSRKNLIYESYHSFFRLLRFPSARNVLWRREHRASMVESENTFQSEPKGIPQLKSVTTLEVRQSKEIELKCLFSKRASLPTL